MKRLIIILVLIAVSGFSITFSQVTSRSVEGSWIGKLNVSAISLRIIFNLTVSGNDSISATMDSPDQGAKGIKMGAVTFENGNLKILAPMILGEYNGTLQNDTTISGTWKQGGQSLPLDLVKMKKEFTLNRPQEPKPPYPYTETEVTVHNPVADIDLGGTLTIPRGDGPFKAAILITGSGTQNRNEELLGHKPFMVIADRLTRSGIAVLRLDDRGAGKSQGNPATATSADFATDIAAAVDFLTKNPKIKADGIGLIGHSEGGIIAPIVASQKNVAFIVSLAGTGIPGDQIIFRQAADISRASHVSEIEIERSLAVNKKIFPILKKEKDNALASEKMLAAYKKILDKGSSPPEEKEKSIQQLKASLNPASFTWLRYFISTDPSLFWKKVKCPVLALNGDKDLQVAADENLPAIEKALRSGGNKSVKTMKLPGLNHLFQHSETGLPSEYGNIEETFSEDVMKIISEWITGLPPS